MAVLWVLVAAFPIALLTTFVRAKVALALAAWFIVPLVPGLALPSTIATIGLFLLVGHIRGASREHEGDKVRPWVALAQAALRSLVASGCAYLLGAFVWWLS